MFGAKTFLKKFHRINAKRPVGIDEAGRGPIAGPVVACAAYIPKPLYIRNMRDAKCIRPDAREKLFEKIFRKNVLYSIGIASEKEIDELNIRQASFLAMRRALEGFTEDFDWVLVDGFAIPGLPYNQKGVVKGDSLIDCIMVAGLIAKVIRDKLMIELSKKIPEYGFERHKGYPTKEHIQNLYTLGPSPLHRKTFSPVKNIIGGL